MEGREALIGLECELAATRIRVAELELAVIAEMRMLRIEAANERRRSLHAAGAEVKRLEEDLAAETARGSAEQAAPTQNAEAEVGGGLAATRSALPQPDPQPPIAPVNIQEIWPAGSDLGHPRSFGVRPPVGDLEALGVSSDEYQRRLKQHLDLASKVLHTSGVVAVVWREWRAFERNVQGKLRAMNAAPAAYL